MPTSDAYNKTDRLHQIQLLFWNNPGQKLRTSEIANKLDVSEDTARRYLTELSSSYTPARGRTFECQFSTYLLEPSSIGRTFYAIGYSNPPDALRTFKMERIEFAELTKESFEVPADFDGPALLARAWGVMYGEEELVEVRLRFSHWVTKRVKETLWHPSQQIVETTEGCEWIAQIGDTLEIENWVRGWGADCEVLAPQELREKMIKEARRLAHMYGVTHAKSMPPDEPDTDLLSQLFGG